MSHATNGDLPLVEIHRPADGPPGNNTPPVAWEGRKCEWLTVVWEWIQNIFAIIFRYEGSFDKQKFDLETLQGRFKKGPAPLKQASETVPTLPLMNLGSLCYLNSTLQLIARLDIFDNAFASREGDDPNTAALRAHLGEIIHRMRHGTDETRITRDQLVALYTLVRAVVPDWANRSRYAQQDAEEFLRGLAEALGVQLQDLLGVDVNDISLESAPIINVTVNGREREPLSELGVKIDRTSRAVLSQLPSLVFLKVNRMDDSGRKMGTAINIAEQGEALPGYTPVAALLQRGSDNAGHYTAATWLDSRVVKYDDSKTPQEVAVDDIASDVVFIAFKRNSPAGQMPV
jgi:hypothetical protein